MSVFVTDGTVRHEIEPLGTVSSVYAETGDFRLSGDLFSPWLLVTPYKPSPIPDVTRVMHRLITWTGWSNRVIADVIGTTHPTVQAIRKGRNPERRLDLTDALFKTAEVVEKLTRLAGADQSRLRMALKTSGPGGETPLQLLSAGEYGRAYLQAMDTLNRRRQEGHLLNTHRTRRPSEDVGLVSDDPDR